MELERNQARFRPWPILLSGDHANQLGWTVFLLFFAGVAAIPYSPILHSA